MKEIFVSLEIAEKLGDINFDCDCLAYHWFDSDKEDWSDILNPAVSTYDGVSNFDLVNFKNPNILPRPTYEQVFKWFRDKGYKSKIIPNLSESYNVGVRDLNLVWVYLKNINTYEEAQENLVLKLIEIYKEWKSKKI